MYNIDEIMNMLDWNNSIEIQQKGIELAKLIKSINIFILPMHPGCNKNVWENCAQILVDKSDEVLNPYLTNLLEWIEDLNWPGALIIMERLKNFSETEMLTFAVEESTKIASATDNHIWLKNLSALLNNEKLKANLPIDILEILEKHSHDYDG